MYLGRQCAEEDKRSRIILNNPVFVNLQEMMAQIQFRRLTFN